MITPEARAKLVAALTHKQDALVAYLDMPGKIQLYKSYCPTKKLILTPQPALQETIQIELNKQLITISRELDKLQM